MGCVSTGTFDTRHVARAERVDYWEASCSADLIGLKCSTMEEESFQAKFDYYDFGNFAVYDISGKPHVICRSAETVRKNERDAVFLTILLEGEAFVNRRQEFSVLKPGDLILYDANTPYMHGYSRSSRQVVFEVPGEDFRTRFPSWGLKDAVYIDGSSGDGHAIARAVRKTHADVCARKFLDEEADLVAGFWSALELSHDLLLGGGELTSYHLGILQRIRAHVRSRIGDAALDTEEVAEAMGMSSRQLNRILAAQDLTVKKLITMERLKRARDMLTDDRRGRMTLGELAGSCGFSGASHLTKSFQRHFGHAPGALMEREPT